MFQHILVVCTGNVCRSPVAGAMLSKHFPDKHIETAGLSALVGQGVAPGALRLAEVDGLDVSSHKARQLTRTMLIDVELVLVMSEGQRRAVDELAPGTLGKILLFGRWLDASDNKGTQGKEIPDPYRKSSEVFTHVHQMLARAAQTWITKL